jgi:glycine cleavage system regulatory protein
VAFSGDGSDTPTLSDVTITYTVAVGGGGLADSRLSVVGGSYNKVSGDSDDWAEGWSIVPEIYCEVVQR